MNLKKGIIKFFKSYVKTTLDIYHYINIPLMALLNFTLIMALSVYLFPDLASNNFSNKVALINIINLVLISASYINWFLEKRGNEK